MANKKAILSIVLILTALFISGCGSMRRGSNEPPVSPAFTATGTDGIVMSFIPEQPPAKIYTQSPLTFLVEIRNRGTHTVQSAAFYLTGYDPNMIMGLPPTHMITTPLEGKSTFNPEGGYTTAEFSTSNVILPANMPNYKPTFMLTACYPYQTTATPLICVDANPLDTTSDKACIVQKVYGTGTQGAPVSVESIEAEARPTGMYFRIHIANSATGGTVFDQQAMGSCPGGLQYRDLNNIRYSVALSGQPLNCEPQGGEIRLVNNKATIFCRHENMQQIPAYQTPIEVILSYGYKSSISKVVEIENIDFRR